MSKVMLTQEELKEALYYNEITGNFHRKNKQIDTENLNEVAGTLTKYGYIRICLGGKFYMAHRLAFMYMTGEMPTQVDHKDNVRNNNAWSNLRAATNLTNSYNAKLRKSNTTGIKGVSINKNSGKFEASLRVNGKKLYFGLYSTVEEAAEIIRAKREQLHGEFVNHG